MQRISLKIVGASGQGINSIGEIIAKALKRKGYCIFGYREYPSLIKGGHASYQLDISDEYIASTQTKVDIVVALNHHVFEHNLREIKPGGILLHATENWKYTQEDAAYIAEQNINVLLLPITEILTRMDAKPLLANTVLTACVWAVLQQDMTDLQTIVAEKFAKKKNLHDLNRRCIEEGEAWHEKNAKHLTVTLPKARKKWAKQLLITGSEAMGLGAIHAGVRLYAGYPMTPSSPLLTFIAAMQNTTGMVVKQAEDEITAAQMVSGAMFMGTRALTATSGGGFDLMSETLSLNAMIENPTVFVLAQRPGPATGLPTWTAQGDLHLAVRSGHGESVRCVIAISDCQDAFDLMSEAFNLAEEYQISVIVLTDKHCAEGLWTQQAYTSGEAIMRRGTLVTDPEECKKLNASDRYDPHAKNGISKRWLPGTEAETYCAQGDEHSADGSVDEAAENAVLQMTKRMNKHNALIDALPEPILYGSKNPTVLIIGWGSTKNVIMDVLKDDTLKDMNIGYLHYTYLWPLKTSLLEKLHKITTKSIVIEGNFEGQLATLIRQESGIKVPHAILKYDGRPFFYDELLEKIKQIVQT